MRRRLQNLWTFAKAAGTRAAAPPGTTTVDTLKELIVAAAAIPLVVFGILAWYSRGETFRHAEEQVVRDDALLHEHATAIFEINDQILHRVEETLRMRPDAGRSDDEAALHEYLKSVRSGAAQAFSIWVLRADGSILASSEVFPAPQEISGADREYFIAHKEHANLGTYIGKPVKGRANGGAANFTISRRRETPGGQFDGVLLTSIENDYFVKEWANIEPELGATTVLVRQDGIVIVRNPPVDVDAPPVPADDPFMKAIGQATQGLVYSTSRVDHEVHISAFKKLERYPVYINYAVAQPAILGVWHRQLVLYGLLCGTASLGLLAMSLLALRRAAGERRAVERLEAETDNRKHAEEALRQAQKMEAVGQLTGGIAHDFNNILTVVIGNLDMLVAALPDTAMRQMGATALRNANRAAELVQRLLAFGRRQALAPKVTNVNQLLFNTSELLMRTLGENIAVDTVLGGGIWPCFVDPPQLEAAIINLALNARDAMPRGGKLTLQTANMHFDESFTARYEGIEPGDYVMLTVSDTGAGIPREHLTKVFEPFFTTKEVGKGSGLGLAQVYGFVKQSGGYVTVYSEVAVGTTIRIYLPRSRVAVDAAEPTEDPVKVPLARQAELVLVVEDDSTVRQYSVEALRGLGYRALEAEDAAAALALLDANGDIALMFTDVGLPDMNGAKLADEATRRRAGLRILYTTGYAGRALAGERAALIGAGVVQKPFTRAQLAVAIRAALDRYAVA